MVAAGAGYSLLPVLAAADGETFGGLIRYTPIDDPHACRSVALAFRTSDPRKGHYRKMAGTIRASLPKTVRLIGEEGAENRRRTRTTRQ